MRRIGQWLAAGALLLLAAYAVMAPDWTERALEPVHQAEAPDAPLRATPAATSPASVSSAQSIHELSQEVSVLRGELSEIKRTLALLRRDVERSLLTPRDHETAESQSDLGEEAAIEEELRVRTELQNSLEGAFHDEIVDDRWSGAVLGEIDSAIHSLEMSEKIRSLECRARTCRLLMAAPDAFDTMDSRSAELPSDRLSELIFRLANTLPAMTAFEVDSGGAEPDLLMYFSRDMDAVP